MMRIRWWLGLLGTIVAIAIIAIATPVRSSVDSSCSYNGKSLHGKVQFVDSFPDIKVEFVSSFPDIKVKWVTSFPDDCGEWQEVDSFPDFKIQEVSSFPDVKVQIVDSFPGLP